MIALIHHRAGSICVAERNDVGGRLVIWKASDGHMWLESWVCVLEELDVRTLDEARLVYPEYFV